MTVLRYPENHSIQSIHTQYQRMFMEQNRENDTAAEFDWAHLKVEGIDYTPPQKINFNWDADSEISTFELSETEAFSEPLTIQTNEKHVAVGNLKAAQTYYWRVNGSEAFSFTTGEAPRFLHVDGLVNVRDNGGWKTADGRRMRQGLLYRGSEMEWQSYHDRDPSKENHQEITEAGIATMLNELKIKTDLDLRVSAFGYLKESPLGETVDLKVIPLLPYYHLLEENQESITKQIFELLANPAAYPIYYHCWGGIDRAGTVAYLLEAFLGVSEADMILDYEISSLSCHGKRVRNSEYFVRFEEALAAFDKEGTLQSRCEKYLRSCGISEETLQALKDNLLEPDL